jgi:hypothetical protein
VVDALAVLADSGAAYSAWPGFDGEFTVYAVHTPLVDADPATLALWEHEYPEAGLVSISWSVLFGAASASEEP